MHSTFSSIHFKAIKTCFENALKEDIATGDVTGLSTLDSSLTGTAQLIVKQDCVLAGIELAEHIFKHFDASLQVTIFYSDGNQVTAGTVALTVQGKVQSILATERTVLNCLQRMSGIATFTKRLSQKINHTACKILDTRKTTPNFRIAEKWAVHIGGGINHRMGLYDVIMIKDNHIDFCGSISAAIEKAFDYVKHQSKNIPIIVETRSLEEVTECLAYPKLSRILLDNMSLEVMREAVQIIDGKIPTEASGSIDETTIVNVAETGVDFVSMGAITYAAKTIDMSLKAV